MRSGRTDSPPGYEAALYPGHYRQPPESKHNLGRGFRKSEQIRGSIAGTGQLLSNGCRENVIFLIVRIWRCEVKNLPLDRKP